MIWKSQQVIILPDFGNKTLVTNHTSYLHVSVTWITYSSCKRIPHQHYQVINKTEVKKNENTLVFKCSKVPSVKMTLSLIEREEKNPKQFEDFEISDPCFTSRGNDIKRHRTTTYVLCGLRRHTWAWGLHGLPKWGKCRISCGFPKWDHGFSVGCLAHSRPTCIPATKQRGTHKVAHIRPL